MGGCQHPSTRGRRLAAGTIVATALLGSVAYGTHHAWGTTWATADVLLGVGVLASYGLHRYELVATGAVGDVRLDE